MMSVPGTSIMTAAQFFGAERKISSAASSRGKEAPSLLIE
jgi:hypothetical protein